MTEYRHVASGVTAFAEISYSNEGTRIIMIATSDPLVSGTPFEVVYRTQTFRENPENPREYTVPNGHDSAPLELTARDLNRDWVAVT